MQLRPEELGKRLQHEALAPVYLLCGEEPLQKEESADAIRARCRKDDITGREVFHVDNKNFDWSSVLAEAGSLSLFAERKLLEVRIHTSGPGKAGGQAIRDLVALGNTDNTLLLICGKLDRNSKSSAWFKTVDGAGVVITAWPLTGKNLSSWIRSRLRAVNMNADTDAVELIASRVEGNLLAAKQEIDRLALLTGEGRLTGPMAADLVNDNARYNVFELANRCLAGRTEAALRVLDTLRSEGIEAPVVLWALSNEIRRLTILSEARSQEQAIRDMRVPPAQRSLYPAALRRIGPRSLPTLLQRAAVVDHSIKGLAPGQPWDELGWLVMAMTGTSVPGNAGPVPTG